MRTCSWQSLDNRSVACPSCESALPWDWNQCRIETCHPGMYRSIFEPEKLPLVRTQLYIKHTTTYFKHSHSTVLPFSLSPPPFLWSSVIQRNHSQHTSKLDSDWPRRSNARPKSRIAPRSASVSLHMQITNNNKKVCVWRYVFRYRTKLHRYPVSSGAYVLDV